MQLAHLDDPAWLDRMYNNRARMPDHARHFDHWRARSRDVRRRGDCVLDIAYGPSAGQKLDVFPSHRPSARTLVFIHGGYWRSLDKSDHSFVAPVFQQAGACVVIPNYDLCPAVTIPDIALQLARALAWTWRHARNYGGDPTQITLVGHSAGGHLAAMLLTCDWPSLDSGVPSGMVRKALSLSGLFDLEPLVHAAFLHDLHLTALDALRTSPAFLPAPRRATLFAVCGSDETEEFQRQNQLIHQGWGTDAVPVCATLEGLNHLSIVDALADPAHTLHELALELLSR